MAIDWTRAQAVFGVASEMAAGERAAYVAEQCADDEELRAAARVRRQGRRPSRWRPIRAEAG